MSDLLYLDTARLGRISPGAARAQADALRLAADEGGSAYFDRFLRSGLDVLPPGFRDRYPGLTSWAGVGELKQSLRRLAGHRPDLPVLLAARSAALMGFAARLLARLCRNVLTTDLGWPPYHDRLVATARRSGRTVTTLAVRDDALAGRATADEVVDRACRAYADNGCDGLFLTAVGHLGVRFPVERVVRAIESRNRVWFVVVDGAQELGHTGADLAGGFCDLYLAGCHKWVRAHHPLGVGFYGRARSRGVVDGVLARMVAAGDLDDPLLGLSARLEADAPAGGTETANLLPLFAARGAAGDARPAVAPGLAGDL
ncbi:MAG: aminotransferase class V-fold PLP-dependent enzyme, partial [Gemmataceae bacterium]|nr:aminotransferase class V-fold PLP-dependent enzyme [Gemmataceae bacterium]